jgi:hypothetical protein
MSCATARNTGRKIRGDKARDSPPSVPTIPPSPTGPAVGRSLLNALVSSGARRPLQSQTDEDFSSDASARTVVNYSTVILRKPVDAFELPALPVEHVPSLATAGSDIDSDINIEVVHSPPCFSRYYATYRDIS